MNFSYARNVKLASARYKDQPMTPQETTVYWVEYIARHQGAPHIKTAARELSFIEYHMIDVFAAMAVIAVIGNILGFIVLQILFRKIFSKKNVEKSKRS